MDDVLSLPEDLERRLSALMPGRSRCLESQPFNAPMKTLLPIKTLIAAAIALNAGQTSAQTATEADLARRLDQLTTELAAEDRSLYNLYMGIVAPQVARWFNQNKEAYIYLCESANAFPDNRHFVTILNKVGFSDTRCKSLSLGICSIYTGRKERS